MEKRNTNKDSFTKAQRMAKLFSLLEMLQILNARTINVDDSVTKRRA
jgi:hypothetical protein